MNKPPSQFYFQRISVATIPMYKDHDNELYAASTLKELFNTLNDDNDVTVSINYNRDMIITVYAKLEYPKEVFEQMTIAYNFERKLKTTKSNLNKAQEFLATLKGSDYTEELAVTKNKLNEIINNDKIPLDKKQGIVARLNSKIAMLESKHFGGNKNIISDLKTKIKELEDDLKIQNEVLALKNCDFKEEKSIDYCSDEYVCD